MVASVYRAHTPHKEKFSAFPCCIRLPREPLTSVKTVCALVN